MYVDHQARSIGFNFEMQHCFKCVALFLFESYSVFGCFSPHIANFETCRIVLQDICVCYDHVNSCVALPQIENNYCRKFARCFLVWCTCRKIYVYVNLCHLNSLQTDQIWQGMGGNFHCFHSKQWLRCLIKRFLKATIYFLHTFTLSRS